MHPARILVASETLAEALVLLKGLVRVVGAEDLETGEVALFVRSPQLSAGDTAVCEVKVDGLIKTISLIRHHPPAVGTPQGVG